MTSDSPDFRSVDLGEKISGFVAGQKMFGRYTLNKLLGRGGMGVVWLATDERLDQEVALKFLPEVVRLDVAALDDLKQETRRSLQLTHRNIVRIFDFEQDGENAALAMEYVAGGTLSALRVTRPKKIFEPTELRHWISEICDALDYAHHRGKMVHRDLKPSNLMVGPQGDLKVADFGTARSISDSMSRITGNPSSIGTLAYMSPQQALGQPATARDDVYSLGATIYELLSSRPPFYTGNIQHQLEHVVPPWIAERREELGIAGKPIPPSWEITIAACLAKDPTARPATVREVCERLLATSSSTQAIAVEAPATGRFERGRSFAMRSSPPLPWDGLSWRLRATALGAVAIFGILAGGAIYYASVTVPRERQEETDRQAREQDRLARQAKSSASDETARRQQAEEQARKEREAAALAAQSPPPSESPLARTSPNDRKLPGVQENPPVPAGDAEESTTPTADGGAGDVNGATDDKSKTGAASKRTGGKKAPSRSQAPPRTFGQKFKHFFGF